MFPMHHLRVFMAGQWQTLDRRSTPEGVRRMEQHMRDLHASSGLPYRIVVDHGHPGEPDLQIIDLVGEQPAADTPEPAIPQESASMTPSTTLTRAADRLDRAAKRATKTGGGAGRWVAVHSPAKTHEEYRQVRKGDENMLVTDDEHGSVLLTSPWADTEIVDFAALMDPFTAKALVALLRAAATEHETCEQACYECEQILPVAKAILRRRGRPTGRGVRTDK